MGKWGDSNLSPFGDFRLLTIDFQRLEMGISWGNDGENLGKWGSRWGDSSHGFVVHKSSTDGGAFQVGWVPGGYRISARRQAMSEAKPSNGKLSAEIG